LTQGRESAGAPTIIGLIPPAKVAARASTAAGTGTHEVICGDGTILKIFPSTDPTATS
jgi:hypothetical protein